MMNEMILWSLWYGILATLPVIMTRLLIKNAMARVAAYRRLPYSINRRWEV